ncbi:MAG TPA: sugar transferase [Chthoniobacteraceae bacterium]|jgi:lipopolysaccharide/colanic/teichoic acid biosynthesis glycosyltransferase|nr:sugar transferase [Chthoniobacteraceae bacterium]
MARRCVDLLVAIAALVLAAPLLIGIAVLIRMKDGRPILFCQSRAGWRGVPFRMIKFRTMRPDAERTGGSLTFCNDARITPLGRFLRRSKLDELPQLFNVLRGEMTLIGPRPEVLDWAEHYTPTQRAVFAFKPGLSDPVQLLFRHEQEFLSSAAAYRGLSTIKVQRQIDYLHSRTVFSDAVVMLRTLRALFPSKPSAEEVAVYAAIRTAAAEAPLADQARR